MSKTASIAAAMAAALATALTPPAKGADDDASRAIPPSGVIGVRDEMLSPGFWTARAPAADAVLLSPQQIDALNRESLDTDPELHDIDKLGATLKRAQIVHWLEEAAPPLTAPLVDSSGRQVTRETLSTIERNAGAHRIAAEEPVRYGLSVRRAQLRTYPSPMRLFPSKDLMDFESLQGGTLFAGDAVAILHTSVDGRWYLVLSYQGPAWVSVFDIAEGPAQDVLAYEHREPFRVVIGDSVRTVYTPESPMLSELQLDMGVRVPLADRPPDQPVNGQGPYESHTIVLPTRRPDGRLRLEPALVQKIRDTAPGYLPLTRANIVRQAFKFLGERYGWGHLYNGRDCSGFTSDVYRTMGVLLPPNSGAQGRSPAFHHQLFSASDTHDDRMRAIAHADIGDLVVVPGHVLMILGRVDGQPYVMQDVPFAVFKDSEGHVRRTKINEVSVTPLLPLLADDDHTYVDAMTSLVHVTAAR